VLSEQTTTSARCLSRTADQGYCSTSAPSHQISPVASRQGMKNIGIAVDARTASSRRTSGVVSELKIPSSPRLTLTAVIPSRTCGRSRAISANVQADAPVSQVSMNRPNISIIASPDTSPHCENSAPAGSSVSCPSVRRSKCPAQSRSQAAPTPSAPTRAQIAPPEQPYHSRTPAATPASVSAARTPRCPIIRTPPLLKLITCGCQSPLIPLVIAR